MNREEDKYAQELLEEDKYAQELLEKLGFKVGQKFTEKELTDALLKYRGLKYQTIKTPQGFIEYPPNEVIDDLNIIFNSSILDLFFVFARKVQ